MQLIVSNDVITQPRSQGLSSCRPLMRFLGNKVDDYCVITVRFDIVGHESVLLSIYETSMHTHYIDLKMQACVAL